MLYCISLYIVFTFIFIRNNLEDFVCISRDYHDSSYFSKNTQIILYYSTFFDIFK